ASGKAPLDGWIEQARTSLMAPLV
ncbi:MAG: hypothetical protein JWP20_476, partial [Roseomonas sp.]|nr:hypothetical protein [Roseomonas sp.]